MATTKQSPAPEGSFALTFESATPDCPRCAGLPTLRVEADDQVIGYVVADWPWDTEISEDPAEHPDRPHYLVEWFGQDTQGLDILGIRSGDPYFIGHAIHDSYRQGTEQG